MMPQQQVQFIHYQPQIDPRHNGMYTPPPQEHHAGYGHPMLGYTQPHAHYYPQPQMYYHPTPYPPKVPFIHPRVMTPTASPPPMIAAPRIVVDHLQPALGPLDTKFIVESRHSPSPPTPSLSACPSTVSSPPASGTFQTPVNGGGYFNFAVESNKEEVNMMSYIENQWSETSRKYTHNLMPQDLGIA